MGTAKIAVSRDNGRLYLNNNGTIAGVKSITAGAVFANTNKTINGDEAWARLDPTKLTAEHAEILWDALVTRYSKNKGSMAAFPDERVEGLNVSEVISLLALFGEKKTNVDYENNKKRGMPEHLRNKTLFVHSGRDLTFGTTKVNLHEDNIVKHDKDKKDFITWATTNKNYSIPIAIKPMGIELNAPLKRTFKIGSWENKADAQGQFPTLAQFLINTPVDGKGRFAVVSDLQEFEDTGSAFVRPNLLLGNSISDIKVKKADKNKIKTPIKTKESTKRVKAVARVKEKKPITGVIELRDLPVGSQIYYVDKIYEDGKVVGERNQIVAWVDQDKILGRNLDLRRFQVSTIKNITGVAIQLDKPDADKLLDRLIGAFKLYAPADGKFYIDTTGTIDEKIVSTVKETDVTVGPIVTPVAETKPTITEDSDDFDKIFSDSPMAYDPTKVGSVVDLPKELAWFHKRFGAQNVKESNKLLTIAADGRQAFSVFTSDCIYIFTGAPEGALYHEAFHRVFLGYLSEETEVECMHQLANNSGI